jgi:ABC-type multidrug transport system fused ATPase/permease subunit
MRSRYKKNNHGSKGKSEKMVWAKPASRFVSRGPGYRQLDDEQYPGFTDNDMQMQPSIMMLGRRPTGFEELGVLEAEFVEELHNTDTETKTDLHLFVQSLSKCLGATKFGLSFEFQDLGFKPPKSTKPILADVSGTINAGSLWGVMGASGAGKCKMEAPDCFPQS